MATPGWELELATAMRQTEELARSREKLSLGKARPAEVGQQFFSMMQAANDNLGREIAAVIKIQSCYRASRARETFHCFQETALQIQRVVRGWLGRIRSRQSRLERERGMNLLFFHHCATVIQKFFQGWWSRRHLHNYYGRKGYLETVEKRGEWTRQHLQADYTVKLNQARQDEEDHMREEFNNLAGELHHLVSTKTIPGVYNPPYNDALPRAFEKPIEQHLRDSLQVRVPKSLRKPRHRIAIASASPRPGRLGVSQSEKIAALGPIKGPPQDLPGRNPHYSRSASAGRMQRVQGPFRSREQIEVANAKASNIHRTVQQSGPYDGPEEDRKMQQRLSKLTRLSPVDFVPPGMPPKQPAPSSVHTSVPYRERPPELRSDYVELPKIRDKPPFFTAMPKDRQFEDYHEGHLLSHGLV